MDVRERKMMDLCYLAYTLFYLQTPPTYIWVPDNGIFLDRESTTATKYTLPMPFRYLQKPKMLICRWELLSAKTKNA